MNKKRAPLALSLILQLLLAGQIAAPLFAQQIAAPPQTPQQSAPPQTPADDEDDVVRITTNLVQIDAVVTDKNGNQITDLRPEDFEIFENNRAQPITNFSYIDNTPAASDATNVEKKDKEKKDKDKNRTTTPLPPARLRPEQVRRTIALVVDDLGLSFESSYFVRESLKKFVDEQMQPNDLVAIIRTRSGMGALQQFTADKRQLYAAIERVRWYPSGRGGIGAFGAIESDPLAEARRTANAIRGGSGRNNGDNSRNNNSRDADNEIGGGEDLDDFRESIFTVGTLGALNYVVRGLRELPGRKSVVLLSDGIRLFNSGGRNERVLLALRRLTDLANRASVVIYAIDARGLQTLGLTAADNTSGLTADDVTAQLEDRRNAFFDSQSGLIYLAQQTGGFAVRNSNDIAGGVRRVLRDQEGYYLLGYRPDPSTFDAVTGRRRFNSFSVKVKRPGLKVRTRTGFYGVTDDEAKPVLARTREGQLANALTSPFAKSGIELRLASVFTNDAKTGSFVQSLLHIGGRDLSFIDEPDGWHKATIDVLAITFDQDGKIINEVNRTEVIRARADAYDLVRRSGFSYSINVPVKQAGAYQLRVAVRDAKSERAGSANQFIEVPNLKKNRLAISGVVIAGAAKPAAQIQNSKVGSAQSPSEGTTSAANSTNSKTGDKMTATDAEIAAAQATPAVRRFRRGTQIDYAYLIYNARLDERTRQPQLETQLRLYRDGEVVFAGRSTAYPIDKQLDFKRLPAFGRLQLGGNLTLGEYVLQVVVTDLLAKEKQRVKAQTVEFEIVK